MENSYWNNDTNNVLPNSLQLQFIFTPALLPIDKKQEWKFIDMNQTNEKSRKRDCYAAFSEEEPFRQLVDIAVDIYNNEIESNIKRRRLLQERSQQACFRCKQMHIKCSGDQPCLHCKVGKKSCSFPAKRGRPPLNKQNKID